MLWKNKVLELVIEGNKESKALGKKAGRFLAKKRDIDITTGPEAELRAKRLQRAAEIAARKGFRAARQNTKEEVFYQRLNKLITETPIVDDEGKTLNTILNPDIFIKHKHGASPTAERRVRKTHHALTKGKTKVPIERARAAIRKIIGSRGSGMFLPRDADTILVKGQEKQMGL